MKVFFIIVAVVAAVLILDLIIVGIIRFLSAKKNGILAFKMFGRNTALTILSFICVLMSIAGLVLNARNVFNCEKILKASEEIGVQAFEDYGLWNPEVELINDEETFLKWKTDQINSKLNGFRRSVCVYILGTATYIFILFSEYYYITKKGAIHFYSSKPKSVFAKKTDDYIELYYSSDSENPFAKYKNTEKNCERFQPVICSGAADPNK